MNSRLVLFEDDGYRGLLPAAYWRSVFELPAGRKISLDCIAQRLATPVSGVWARDWMAEVAAQRCGAPANLPIEPGTVLANGRWIPCERVDVPPGPCVGETSDGSVAFVACDAELSGSLRPRDLLDAHRRACVLADVPRVRAAGRMIHHPWDVLSTLGEMLEDDWNTGDASLESLLPGGVLHGPVERLHLGEHCEVHPTAVLNTASGTIFLGDHVVVGPLAVLEGPLYVGPGSRIHAHAWLHGGNAIGPVCRIGGEVHGCVIQGYTNKQHLGFLGHSYVGSWVNIGAGTSNSDLKNTYGKVRVPINGREVESGQTFLGAIIGDHAKIGINASVPTGAVIGFAASIATTAMLPKFVPSFAWLAGDRMVAGDPMRAMDVASAMMARRNVDLTDEEAALFGELPRLAREHETGAVA